ncbi:Sirohydrochlorin cobaltochelatase [Tetrabaena socialis]|uniref:Sirohydrochlorin cobaltochelatase n=1 Tax=Tetrabaena socialis TaxID=47790 RepID=A0A2J7ZUY2_9CHLO|nr:Sirohydrochlorin cobaltochelatase [Tetrabaena socialis]|eukprot:PNH04072.1 Sirohydrochlorin cobaltochelatase [Tetrabaena socialis]
MALNAAAQRQAAAHACRLPTSCRLIAATRRARSASLAASGPIAAPCVSTGVSASTSYAPTAAPHGHRQRRRGRVVASAGAGAQQAKVDKVGVVIVDHGSRKKESNEMLVEFGRLYGSLTGHDIVEIAHMEIAEPTIEQAVGRCAARGARTVVVAPYFLSRGRHIQQDIPLLVAQAAEAHPGLSCVIADPIGLDPLMAQLISNRVATALEGRSGSGPVPTATMPLPPPVAGTQPPRAVVEAQPSAAVTFAITAVAAVATAAAAISSWSSVV